MKTLRRLSMFFVLLLSVFAVYAGGIGNAKDLVAFAKAVNNGEDISAWRNEKGHIALEGDIDMAKVKKWVPIKEFKGTFDGKGHALLNWKTKQGLFDLIAENGVVQNLRIDASCSMDVLTKCDEVIAGFIARVNKGTIRNCENGGSIKYKGAYTEKHIYIGGLVGQNGFIITDSRNTGNIDASLFIASESKTLNICVAGIASSTIPKGSRIIMINRCENSGKIEFDGDAPRVYVAGIIGYSGRAGVRYCVNRGEISSNGVVGNPDARYYNNVAGVVAQSGQHVQCCDNFGKVSVSGTHSSYAGGVCAALNKACNILGCSNYGDVISTASVSSNFAGILGASGDGAHLCNCNNYGTVSFKGTTSKSGSHIGGIAGYIFSKKNTKYGSRLLRCNNMGKINCDIEHNKFYVGGVIGRIRGSEVAPVIVEDCSHQGEISGEGCRVGDITAYKTFTTIKGEYFHNNMAKAVDEPKGDKTIFGRVTSTTGEPVVGAVVSDGEFSVQTNEEGYYEIKSNLASARFVTISTPSDYKFSFRKSVPQNFLRVPRHAKAVEANFTLEKREKSTDKYTVVMIGDPQIKGYNVDSAAYKLRNKIYPDIIALQESKAEKEGEFFAINLGDLVFNDMAKLYDYVDVISDSNVPMFHAIGNHDHDQTTHQETKLGTMHFEEYLTPSYYSFNVGKIHYVIVNDISFSRKNYKQKYRLGLEYWHYKWLERDLQFVPKDHTIVICGHAQLFRHFGNKDADSKKNLSYARYSKLLSQYARVYSWSGHYHYNFGYDYANSTDEAHAPLKNITSICVARATGGLHCNRDLYNDGTPNGYMVMEVDGENVEWYYKSIGHDRDYQMHVYAPHRTGGELVKVNIWNWSKDYWSNPEWWENGVKVGDMTHKFEKDIAFVEDHKAKGPHMYSPKSKHDTAKPYNAHGMFHIKPSEGVRSGEVRVTDNFGKTYIQKVEW
ncbi:MAG: calcineurin-like phosphoesterase family protein [Alistipes sp.]|nr:calcineurin-like phosphoesterase family protein [Alistipes sp.]